MRIGMGMLLAVEAVLLAVVVAQEPEVTALPETIPVTEEAPALEATEAVTVEEPAQVVEEAQVTEPNQPVEAVIEPNQPIEAVAEPNQPADAEGKAAEQIESDWNDFLHYTMIGRFDLAQGFGQRLLEGKPDPLVLLDLSEQNPKGYQLLLKMQEDSEQ